MNKVSFIKVVAKLYFVGALAASFMHLIESGHKLELQAWETWTLPFMIDGFALVGMLMRGSEFSKATRKLGFRIQMGMGAVSLAGNVYAAHNRGGIAYGIAIVAMYLFLEYVSDRIQGAEVDVQAEAERIAREAAQAEADKKAAAIAKGQATRAKNARTKKAQVKALESMLDR
jgi:hypothetical protein